MVHIQLVNHSHLFAHMVYFDAQGGFSEKMLFIYCLVVCLGSYVRKEINVVLSRSMELIEHLIKKVFFF